MSFERVLNKHNDHNIFIMPRKHRNRDIPVMGLYCRDCVKLIKWLADGEALALVDAGVDVEEMLKNEI